MVPYIFRFPISGLLFVILLLSSCSAPRQSLSEPIQPLPLKKGDLRISVSTGGFSDANVVGNLQAAYTVMDKISVGLNYYGVGPEQKKDRGDNYAKSYMGEAFVGTNWFKPLKVYQPEGTDGEELSKYNGILLDVSAGYGLSDLYGKPSGKSDGNINGGIGFNGDFMFHTRYAFLQTSFLVKSKWVDVGMSLRGIGLKYIRGVVNGQRFTNRQELFIAQAQAEGMFTYLETAFRFSAGSPKVKVFTTVSVISNVFGDKTMIHLPKPLMLGLEFNLNEFSKKGS